MLANLQRVVDVYDFIVAGCFLAIHIIIVLSYIGVL